MIEWNGEGMPLAAPNVKVRVKYFDGSFDEGIFQSFYWAEGSRIVAYEFVEPLKAPAFDSVEEAQMADAKPINDSQRRKNQPIARGCLDYFPDALLAVSEVSRIANEKHNPGMPMHWSKGKSDDHADCCVRHLIERGKWDTSMQERVRHSALAAWRALANLQIEIENEREAA